MKEEEITRKKIKRKGEEKEEGQKDEGGGRKEKRTINETIMIEYRTTLREETADQSCELNVQQEVSILVCFFFFQLCFKMHIKIHINVKHGCRATPLMQVEV